MHGRPRNASKPEEEAASAAKAVQLRSLQSQFMTNHHDKMYNLLLHFHRISVLPRFLVRFEGSFVYLLIICCFFGF